MRELCHCDGPPHIWDAGWCPPRPGNGTVQVNITINVGGQHA